MRPRQRAVAVVHDAGDAKRIIVGVGLEAGSARVVHLRDLAACVEGALGGSAVAPGQARDGADAGGLVELEVGLLTIRNCATNRSLRRNSNSTTPHHRRFLPIILATQFRIAK